MATVFAVVGAHREAPDRLLLLGDDGQYYACDDAALPPTPLAMTAGEPPDEWILDAADLDLDAPAAGPTILAASPAAEPRTPHTPPWDRIATHLRIRLAPRW